MNDEQDESSLTIVLCLDCDDALWYLLTPLFEPVVWVQTRKEATKSTA